MEFLAMAPASEVGPEKGPHRNDQYCN